MRLQKGQCAGMITMGSIFLLIVHRSQFEKDLNGQQHSSHGKINFISPIMMTGPQFSTMLLEDKGCIQPGSIQGESGPWSLEESRQEGSTVQDKAVTQMDTDSHWFPRRLSKQSSDMLRRTRWLPDNWQSKNKLEFNRIQSLKSSPAYQYRRLEAEHDLARSGRGASTKRFRY